MSGHLGSFLVGVGWAAILLFYTTFIDPDGPPLSGERNGLGVYTVSDVIIVGGGTGLMLSVIDRCFSSAIFGIAGFALATAAVVVGRRIWT